MHKIKALGKAFLCRILERQVQKLRKRNQLKVVAVVGSVGKTSTKLAIAKTLGATRRVLYQEGNYNDPLTVPLIFFGDTEPSIFNVVAWLRLLARNRQKLTADYPYDIVVVELGTDTPGTMRQFAYLHPDICVVTAVTPEHMEYFGTLDAVASEELVVFDYSAQVLVNADEVPAKYLAGKQFVSYGLDVAASYQASGLKTSDLQSSSVTVTLPDKTTMQTTLAIVGKQGAKIELAAIAVAHMLGLTPPEIVQGLAGVKPFAGRMQILPGIQNSTLIDDTYNASPVAVKAGLDVLYAAGATQRIALLGNMNELGDYSAEAHQKVGAYCDPKKLAWVVTIGPDAEKYLAPVAAKAGCQVQSFSSPYDAGAFIKEKLQTGAVVLAEGSQNGVFAEEALKVLLADPADAAKLVRQSAYWLAIKRKQFPPAKTSTVIPN